MSRPSGDADVRGSKAVDATLEAVALEGVRSGKLTVSQHDLALIAGLACTAES